jgi:hypothetical protein
VKLVCLLGLWLWGAPAPELPQETPPEKILEPPTVPAAPVPPGSARLDTSSPPPAPPEMSEVPSTPPAVSTGPSAPPAVSAGPSAPPAVSAGPSAPPAPVPVQAASPRPPEAPRFGAMGQVALMTAFGASLGHLGVDTGDTLMTGVFVAPSIHYLHAPDDSGGLELFFRFDQTTGADQLQEKSASYGLIAELGVDRWLGQRVSVWPRLGVGFAQTRATLSTTSGVTQSIGDVIVNPGQPVSVTQNALIFRLYAPFLIHLGSSAFIGIGPDVFLDVLHTGPRIGDRSFVGLSVAAGGWR